VCEPFQKENGERARIMVICVERLLSGQLKRLNGCKIYG